ncbi:MAG: hypothetical protein V3W41_02135 [Planctomycetota bacterium]
MFRSAILVLALVASLLGSLGAQQALRDFSSLPVREVFVFKDAHAFVIRRGEVTLDADGKIMVKDLPNPVLGTFWPQVLTDGYALESVTASRMKVASKRPAKSMLELVRINVGNIVKITDVYDHTVTGVIVSAAYDEFLPDAQPQIAMVKSGTETLAVDLTRLKQVSFPGEYVAEVSETKMQKVLELKVAGDDLAGAKVKVSLSWVESGLRWIPSYQIDVDGEGKAAVKLQASFMNDLIDLDDTLVHLVVGVPNFRFHDVKDPISLNAVAQQTAAAGRRTPGYRGDARSLASNFITTQVAGGYVPAAGNGEITALKGSDLEDLYIYDFGKVTLKKGARMAKPVTSFNLDYEDIYVLDLTLRPPEAALRALGSSRNGRLPQAPKVEHRLRFSNNQSAPFTTGPALLLRKGMVIAQGMMTYTPPGARVDIALTAALNIQVRVDAEEIDRTPNALLLDDRHFEQYDIRGRIECHNRLNKTVKIEIKKFLLGEVDSASDKASYRRLSVFEVTGSQGVLPSSWWNYGWPSWWMRANGISEIKWTIELEAGKERKLTADWHYFWRHK